MTFLKHEPINNTIFHLKEFMNTFILFQQVYLSWLHIFEVAETGSAEK